MSSREEKIQKILALRELKRRRLLRKSNYTPNDGQSPVHKSKAKERWVFSGNGAGKTTLLVQELWAAATGVNPWTGENTTVPVRMCLVVDNIRKVDEVIMPEFRKWFHIDDDATKKDGKPHTNRLLWKNGSELVFFSQEADPTTFEGVSFDFSAADEPLPRSLWIALTRGSRNKGRPNRWLYCGTALSQPWMRTEIYEPWARGELEGNDCFRAGTDVNKNNLADGYIETFSKKLSEAEREVRLKGGFFDSAGLALGHLWDRHHHIIKSADLHWQIDEFPVVIAVDPHPSKNHVAVLVGADRDNYIYCLDELSKKLPSREFAHLLVDTWGSYYITDVVVDNFGSADSTGQEGFTSFIDVLNQVFKEREVRFRARPTTYDEKGDEAFIARLQDSLLIPDKPNNFGQTIPKLRVVDKCRLVIENIETVGWQRDKRLNITKPKLDITQKDGLAALKYALAANIHFKRGRTKPYYVQKPIYGIQRQGPQKRVRGKIRIRATKTPARGFLDD